MKEYIVLMNREHYNLLGIVRTLGEAGIRSIVVAVRGELQFVGQSKYVKEAYYVENLETGIQLVREKFGGGSEKSFILCGDDVTVAMLDSHYDELKDDFCFFNAGQEGRLNHYMNKEVMMDLAVRHGFRIPRTWKVRAGQIPQDIEYPVITKAITSTGEEWKEIVFICHDDNELSDAFRKMKSEYVLLQKYIRKTDEVTFDTVSINRGREVFPVLMTTQVYNIPDQYSPYWRIHNYRDTEMQQRIAAIIAEIGFEGICDFQFLKDQNGDLLFMEANFRNVAPGFASTVAGMPEIINWCESMERGYIDADAYYREIPEGFTAIAECWDYDVRVKGGVMTKEEWLKEYMTANCKLYFGRDDFEPFRLFMEYKQTHAM